MRGVGRNEAVPERRVPSSTPHPPLRGTPGPPLWLRAFVIGKAKSLAFPGLRPPLLTPQGEKGKIAPPGPPQRLRAFVVGKAKSLAFPGPWSRSPEMEMQPRPGWGRTGKGGCWGQGRGRKSPPHRHGFAVPPLPHFVRERKRQPCRALPRKNLGSSPPRRGGEVARRSRDGEGAAARQADLR